MGVYAIRRDHAPSTIHISYDRAWRSMNRKIHERCIRYFETRKEAECYIQTGYGYGYRYVPPVKVKEVVYTDGCSFGNRRHGGQFAGWGIWYGVADWRNGCGPVPRSEPQTNQYAELLAMSKALERALDVAERLGQHTEIYTDSKYVLHCLTDWGDKWDRIGYYTSSGGPVSHASLIKRCRRLLNDANEHLEEWWMWEITRVEIHYVPAHRGYLGNEGADALAKQGAVMQR